MNHADAIQYIWEAIQESERSDDLLFIDALARGMLPARSEVLSRESIAAVAADLESVPPAGPGGRRSDWSHTG